MEALNWKRWVGEYQDRLSAPSKTHLTEDGKTTLCGKEIPVYEDCYEVEGQAVYNADCKKCTSNAANEVKS